MRKSTATAIVARRLRVPDGRAEHLVQRASEAQLLPTASGSNVPDLGPHEIANVFLAVAVDRGLGSVGRTVSEFANLPGDNGATFGDALAVLFSNGPALQRAVTGSMVIRLEPPSVSLTLGGIHARYGPEPPADTAAHHVVVPGRTLAAIGLELGGRSSTEADAIVALACASRSLDLAAAFSPMETQ